MHSALLVLESLSLWMIRQPPTNNGCPGDRVVGLGRQRKCWSILRPKTLRRPGEQSLNLSFGKMAQICLDARIVHVFLEVCYPGVL